MSSSASNGFLMPKKICFPAGAQSQSRHLRQAEHTKSGLAGDHSMLSANCPQYSLSAEAASAFAGDPGSAASYLLTIR